MTVEVLREIAYIAIAILTASMTLAYVYADAEVSLGKSETVMMVDSADAEVQITSSDAQIDYSLASVVIQMSVNGVTIE